MADKIKEKDTAQDQKPEPQQSRYGTQEIIGEGNLIQFVVFNLADEEFGVDIDQVKEIIKVSTVTPLPDSPEFIKGLTNVRGDIIAVIDLKKRFFLPEKEGVDSKHIVITREQKNVLGIMVDEVTEVLRVPQKEIKPTPGIVTVIHKKYMSGVITLGDRLIILLDLKTVLSEEELERLSEFQSNVLKKKEPQLRTEIQEGAEEKIENLKKEEIKESSKAETIKESKPAKASKKVKGKGGK